MIEFKYCRLPDTVEGMEYRTAKTPNMRMMVTSDQVADPDGPNYARFVPPGYCYVDCDDEETDVEFARIVSTMGIRCLILETTRGHHYMFRTNPAYKKDVTKGTNWIGLKYDMKKGDDKHKAVQCIKIQGNVRDERPSWDIGLGGASDLDVMPKWMLCPDKLFEKGGHGEDRDASAGDDVYTVADNPVTRLVGMQEGGRNDHIFRYVGRFLCSNSWSLVDAHEILEMINRCYLIYNGGTMSDTDLYAGLDAKWMEYCASMNEKGYMWDEQKSIWVKTQKIDKLDQVLLADMLYKENNYKIYNEGLVLIREDGKILRSLATIHDDTRMKYLGTQNMTTSFLEEVDEQIYEKCIKERKRI